MLEKEMCRKTNFAHKKKPRPMVGAFLFGQYFTDNLPNNYGQNQPKPQLPFVPKKPPLASGYYFFDNHVFAYQCVGKHCLTYVERVKLLNNLGFHAVFVYIKGVFFAHKHRVQSTPRLYYGVVHISGVGIGQLRVFSQ